MGSGTKEPGGHQQASDDVGVVSRRTFIGLSLGALGSLLVGCEPAPAEPTTTPTSAPIVPASPTAEAIGRPAPVSPFPAVPSSRAPAASVSASPTATFTPEAPTATPLPATYTPVPSTPTPPPPPTATVPPMLGRAQLMAHWPTVSASRVVMVRHSGVWAGGTPDPAIVLQMLDESLQALTAIGDVLAVWRVLFEPGERVLLKVNCIAYGGPTQPAVTYAVAQRLQDAGLPAENILIFDRTDHELAAAGYALNDGGPGVRCRGSRGEGSEVALSQARVRFFQEIDACDAIINLPIPKQHGTAGVSVSLKNHYGSVNKPGALHGNWCDPAIAEINAQPQIRDKTRLIVGAALNTSPRDWNRPERENRLLLSFDPVALDTVCRDILVRQRQALGLDAGFLVEGSQHLQTAQSLNVGATDVNRIDLREVVLA